MAQELRRKTIHLLGLIVPILYLFTTRQNAIIGVGGLVALALGAELLKILFPTFRVIFLRIFSPILRSQERKGGLTGTTYYLIGSFLCILFFDKTLAIVCLCFLTLGDLFAALIGKQWGRIKTLFPKKPRRQPCLFHRVHSDCTADGASPGRRNYRGDCCSIDRTLAHWNRRQCDDALNFGVGDAHINQQLAILVPFQRKNLLLGRGRFFPVHLGI